MIRSTILVLFSFLFTAPLFAQYYPTQYRVSGQEWMEIRSEHFRIIYPDRYKNEAIRSLAILEAEYDDIQSLVGGRLHNFPFILNPENDRSNGFVSPMNFRSEIELAPIKGKALNPQSGDWLESVLPHELVHAMHFNVNPPALTRVLGLFSPDMRRSVHAAAPLGVLEGIAVEHESHGSVSNSGRGNYPYFTNQFTALLDTPHQWSMGQLVHVSDFTLPFNRHYNGGYELTNWLQQTYGEETIKQAIRFHYRYPFFGYGAALRHATGEWPASLYKEFTEFANDRETDRLSAIDNETDSISHEISFDATCRRMNRPLWLTENTLLFYARSCNSPAGFYVYDLSDDTYHLLKEVLISEDFYYSLSADRTRLYYSRYHADITYDNLFRGDVHELELATGISRRISRKQRLFSPESSGTSLLALQTDSHTQNLVELDRQTGRIVQMFEQEEGSTQFQVAANPVDPNIIALAGKVKSVQGIWFESINTRERLLSREPDIVFEGGSIFDLHWSRDGDRLLFVSDFSGTMNVFEYNRDSDTVVQVTQSIHNAFEPAYSPDESTIAYIRQAGNEQILHTLNVSNTVQKPVDESLWRPNTTTAQQLNRPLLNRENIDMPADWEPSEYNTGLSWLKPRLWLPTYERVSGFDKIGVNFESVDLMNSQSYSLDLNHYLDRVWYDLSYSHKTFYPGFQLDLFNRPAITNFRITQNGQEFIQAFLQQSRGASLKIPVRFRIESNARFTSLLLEPQYFINQIRFLDPQNSSTAFSEFGTRHTVGFRTVFNLRLRQFVRDVQPNSGYIFFTESRYGLNSTELEITTNDFSLTGNLVDRKGFRGGIITYLAPLQIWNQSLQIRTEVITQTDLPVFNTSSLYSESFSEDPFPAANNVGLLNTRYTIPLVFPDDGGLLLPVYLSNVYLVLFSQTAADLNSSDLINGSRSVYGLGVRSRFRLSNLSFDLGVSIGWEPTRNNFTGSFGSF